MKSFEEKFTAWTDGTMSEPECAAFQLELREHPEAADERLSALHLGDFLRTHCAAVELPNPEFFNQRIRREIEELSPETAVSEPAETPRRFPGWRLVWGGALCLLAGAALFQFAVPHGSYVSNGRDAYLAEVLETRTGSDSIYASSFHTTKNNVTVLWLDGLPYIPETYAAQ